MKKIIAAALMLPALAQAEFINGNDLLSRMNGDGGGPMYAIGYIAGVSDVYYKTLICPPEGVNLGQMKDMVRSHLVTHPETRHYSADSLIVNVLKAAFPCKQTGQQI